MRKSIINSLVAVTLAASLTSCGDKWLETDMYSGVDTDTALSNTTNIGYALTGTYYQLMRYYFAGNYATTLGDLASDIVYWNTSTGHQNQIYTFTYSDTDNTLYYIWSYGYKVIDNSARIIDAAEELLPRAEGEEEAYLKLYDAEARCLRAYASLVLVNAFAHQAMVNGTSYLDQPGIVIVDKPIVAYSKVERSTIGETYNFILKDLNEAISYFSEVGDRQDQKYFGLASAYGLLARANTYLENWQAAATAAKNAIEESGIDTLAYTDAEYAALYANGDSNWESMFSLGITAIDNFSANSCGTLFSTYSYSHSPYLWSLYGAGDCRTSIMYWNGKGYDNDYSAAKFYYGGGNPALATNYLINAPEMFLIQAEAYANLNQIPDAQSALLTVAMRNPAIQSTSDLPASQSGILSFLKDERARELFQEGHRLWDLRRWGAKTNLYATHAPEIDWMIKDANCGDIVLPIPVDEINTGAGVTQNTGWQNTRPR